MKIGIDISQLAYEGTGVAQYLANLVENILKIDQDNEYILFYSSLRRKLSPSILNKLSSSSAKIIHHRIPPLLLDILWNRLHIFPIENFIGDIDIFISSDWTQPPVKNAKRLTIMYDLIVYKHPDETDDKIVETQKRRLKWVAKECDKIICISESTKKDALKILKIPENKFEIVYPGI